MNRSREEALQPKRSLVNRVRFDLSDVGMCIVGQRKVLPVTIHNRGGQTCFSIRNRKQQVVHEGVTPDQVVLDAKSAPFWPAKYDVTFVGTSDVVQKRELKAGLDPWLGGNILLGGVIGLAVDGTTGAMFRLPEKVIGDIPEQYALLDTNQGAKIAATHVGPVQRSVGIVGGQETGGIVEQVTYEDAADTVTSSDQEE